jgi:trk system potassium uptake protein TrkH
MPPAFVLVLGFLVLIATGTTLLALPLASRNGAWTDPLVALFTATSAACVTGLVVVDTGTYWSGFGQLVILMLVQAGGFGIMTGSTLLLQLMLRRGTRLRDRLLVRESIGVVKLGEVSGVVRRVAAFTLLAEAAGAVILAIAFLARGAVADPLAGAWWGMFHAVSAFNNAGFDLTGGFRSLGPFFDDGLILGTIGILIILGGLGYGIVADTLVQRRWRRLALETRLVLSTSAALLVGGALAILLLEWDNPATLGGYPAAQRPLNALFESVTLRTAGFSVTPTGSLLEPTLIIAMAMMFIGGASGSTAGGVKVNTFALLLAAIVSTARGDAEVSAFGRRVRHDLVYRAMAVALLFVAFLVIATFLLILMTDVGLVAVLFEVVSAAATVGLSTGITPDLQPAAQLVLIVAMFMGRLGPLTLVVALTARQRSVGFRPAAASVRIG